MSASSSPSASSPALLPHPTLSGYYASGQEKRGFLDRVFDKAAGDYDRVENLMALGTGRWYRRQALLRAGLSRGMRVLDVAVGTGLVAREEVRIVGGSSLVVGLDPSPAMMQRAIQSLGIQTVLGVGEKIPLEDARFDFVSMGYALRHLGDIRAAFAEFHRVLKPGGRVCILEISKPRTNFHRSMLRGYMRYIVPSIARVSSQNSGGADSKLLWQYYWDTIEACVAPETVIECLTACGFGEVKHHSELGMFSEFTATRPVPAAAKRLPE